MTTDNRSNNDLAETIRNLRKFKSIHLVVSQVLSFIIEEDRADLVNNITKSDEATSSSQALDDREARLDGMYRQILGPGGVVEVLESME